MKKTIASSESEDIKDLGLKIKGVVTNISELSYGHDYGIITIRILASNLDFYDKRNEQDKFFGVIKNDKAEIVFNGISEINIGDTFVLEGERYKIYRNEKLAIEDKFTLLSGVLNPYNEVRSKLKL